MSEDIFISSPWQMWATITVIIGTIIAYASDKFSMELVSVSTLICLLIIFQLAPINGVDETPIAQPPSM